MGRKSSSKKKQRTQKAPAVAAAPRERREATGLGGRLAQVPPARTSIDYTEVRRDIRRVLFLWGGMAVLLAGLVGVNRQTDWLRIAGGQAAAFLELR